LLKKETLVPNGEAPLFRETPQLRHKGGRSLMASVPEARAAAEKENPSRRKPEHSQAVITTNAGQEKVR